jgi:hypothetical protein
VQEVLAKGVASVKVVYEAERVVLA